MVIGAKLPRPTTSDEGRDHNTGVSMFRALAGYLEKRKPEARRFFMDLWKSEQQALFGAEMKEATGRWMGDRKNKDRAAFARMTEMHTWEFALRAVSPVAPTPIERRSHLRRPSTRVVH